MSDKEHGRAGQRAYLQSARARPSRTCIFTEEHRRLGERHVLSACVHVCE